MLTRSSRILREFRVWLDAARLFLLLMLNIGKDLRFNPPSFINVLIILSFIGVAAFFTYWNPKFQCPTTCK